MFSIFRVDKHNLPHIAYLPGRVFNMIAIEVVLFKLALLKYGIKGSDGNIS